MKFSEGKKRIVARSLYVESTKPTQDLGFATIASRVAGRFKLYLPALENKAIPIGKCEDFQAWSIWFRFQP